MLIQLYIKRPTWFPLHAITALRVVNLNQTLVIIDHGRSHLHDHINMHGKLLVWIKIHLCAQRYLVSGWHKMATISQIFSDSYPEYIWPVKSKVKKFTAEIISFHTIDD